MTDQAEAQEQETEGEGEQEAAPQETGAEAKAREIGWRPKDEWEGDDSHWMEAEAFSDRNERLKTRADGIAKAEISSLKGTVSDLTQTIDDLKGHLGRAEKSAYDRALKDIKAKQRQAVADGDQAAFDEAEGEATALQKQAEEAKPKPSSKREASPDDDPEFVEWLTDNRWYDPKSESVDLELRAFANSIAPEAAAMGLKGKALYERVGKEVKKKFPEAFGNKRRRAAPAVEGSTRATNGSGKGHGYSDLPADAKAACDRLVKQKVWGKDVSAKDAREKYCNDYEWE